MSRRLGARSVTVALFATASLVGAVGLSSCASGNDAMTNMSRTTTNSVSGAVGTIALRNLYVAGPVEPGASAQIVSAFFNGGAEEDEIIGISSPDAASGRPPTDPVLLPGDTKIFIADGTAPALVGLKAAQLLGSQVSVTFTFAKAGSVTLLVPVQEPAPGASEPFTEPSATESAPATAEPPATEPPATGPAPTAPVTPTPTAP